VRRASVLLATAALVAFLFDTEGLLTWARRLEAGRTQDVVIATLTPVHDSLSGLSLDVPRHWLAAHAPGQGDAVLARGWVDPTVRHVVAVPLMQLSLEAPATEPTALTSAPTPAPRRSGGVLLLGDSMMAGSLGATLERTLARSSDDVPVTRAAQLGTGLARPDLYDWMAVIPALLEREHPKFVVVSLGANDGTTLRDGDTAIDFGDPKWRQVYAARVDTVMRTLAGEDTHVLWLLLPPMRDARLNARGAVLNTLFTQRAKRAPRVEVLELDVLLSNDDRHDRQYATFVQTDDGRLVRYRLDDGVHLAPAGSRAVARWVQDWVRERHRTKPTRPRPK
jgi:hypothetical protein